MLDRRRTSPLALDTLFRRNPYVQRRRCAVIKAAGDAASAAVVWGDGGAAREQAESTVARRFGSALGRAPKQGPTAASENWARRERAVAVAVAETKAAALVAAARRGAGVLAHQWNTRWIKPMPR